MTTPERGSSSGLTFEFIEGGWLGVAGLPGWDGFKVAVKVGRVSGEPRIVGLSLDPEVDARPADVALTQVRLRRFPLGALAPVAYRWATLRPETMADLMAAIEAAAADVSEARRDPRQVTTVEHVAAVFTQARKDGLKPRKAVCDVLHISPRTAARYISEARKRGLLDEPEDRKAGAGDDE